MGEKAELKGSEVLFEWEGLNRPPGGVVNNDQART
jgi:hypothetical protein